MYDNTKRDQFVELRAQGKSFAAIAEELGVSKPTLIEWSRELREQVTNLRAVENEATLEKYRITTERTVRILAQQLDKIERAIEPRDYTSMPDDKLIASLIRILGEIRDLQRPVVLHGSELNPVDLMSPVKWEG